VVDVQSVISREKDPAEVGIISIGSFNAGTAGNIIPDEAVLRGTIRTFKPDVRAKMLDGIERTAKAVAAMANAPAPDIIITEGIKAVINDPALVATAEKGLKPAFGEKMNLSPANTTSEDFSEFGGSGVPLMMFNIGVYDLDAWAAANKSGTPLPGNHSPLFAPVPKPTIRTGVTAMSLAVLSAFDQRARGP
jgi:hippurate hydrolase